jgi:excisionase family DNA binding protein
VSAIAQALLAELDEKALDQLADALLPRLRARLAREAVSQKDAWLDVEAAAEHLACPKSRLYAMVSARRIPFHKDGSRTLFDRDELDAWVRSGGARRP